MTLYRPPFLAPAGAVALAAALAGCVTVGPDYVRPEPAVGEGWSAAEAPQGAISPEILGTWWRRFDDPTLERLVASARARNLDVRQAAARIAEARAVRDRVAGRELPAAAATGGVTERRQSENGTLPIAQIPGLDRDQTIVDVGFDASWEADLFGRTRRAVETAEARLGGAFEEHRAVQFAVAAEVASTYLALRGGQRRLAAIEAATESVRRTAELVEARVDAGESARVELFRAWGDLRALEARLPLLRAELTALSLALGPLVGEAPEAQLALLDETPATPQLSPFPLGERSDLLRRRPDVRAAERRLAAATAEIGLATAELYPRLSIGARGGFQALDGTDLLQSSSATWSIVPAISWRIFDGGRVRAEIRIAEARAEAAARAWEAAVLAALTDAERALARYRGGLDALELRQAAVLAASRTRDLERLRYQAGDSSLLSLLDAQRRLDELEAELEDTRIAAAGDLVSLIKALGGGWAGESTALSTPAIEPVHSLESLAG